MRKAARLGCWGRGIPLFAHPATGPPQAGDSPPAMRSSVRRRAALDRKGRGDGRKRRRSGKTRAGKGGGDGRGIPSPSSRCPACRCRMRRPVAVAVGSLRCGLGRSEAARHVRCARAHFWRSRLGGTSGGAGSGRASPTVRADISGTFPCSHDFGGFWTIQAYDGVRERADPGAVPWRCSFSRPDAADGREG